MSRCDPKTAKKNMRIEAKKIFTFAPLAALRFSATCYCRKVMSDSICDCVSRMGCTFLVRPTMQTQTLFGLYLRGDLRTFVR